MKNFDWQIHNVLDDPISFHTHGLDKYGSLEIEVVLPLYQKEGMTFCNCIGAAIRDGLKIEDGLMIEGLFNLPVFFFKTMPIHGDNLVYRAVFPDERGFYPWDMNGSIRCTEPYKSQITFNKDKVFFLQVNGVKETEFKRFSPFYTFSKRGNAFICPVQYFVAGANAELVKIEPYQGQGYSELLRDLQFYYDLQSVKLLCKDVDPTDSINKPFCEWKRENW